MKIVKVYTEEREKLKKSCIAFWCTTGIFPIVACKLKFHFYVDLGGGDDVAASFAFYPSLLLLFLAGSVKTAP